MNDWARPPEMQAAFRSSGRAVPAPGGGAAGGTGADPRDISTCVVCGGTAIAKKCKIVCRNCGYTRDCSDP